MITQASAFLLDALNALIANVLTGPSSAHTTMHLAKALMNITPNSTPSSFTEADYSGYAAVSITSWNTAHLLPNLNAETISPTVAAFVPTGTTTLNTIFGFWLVAGDGTYLGAEALATPFPLLGPSTPLYMLPTIQLGPTQWVTPQIN